MKEITKRYINIHPTYSPLGHVHQQMVPSYPYAGGVLPDLTYYFCPPLDPVYYAPEKEAPFYLPILQENVEPRVVDLPLTYPNLTLSSYQQQQQHQQQQHQHISTLQLNQIVAFNSLPSPASINTVSGLTIKDALLHLSSQDQLLPGGGVVFKEGYIKELASPYIKELASHSILGLRSPEQKVYQYKNARPVTSQSRVSPTTKPCSPLLDAFRNNRCSTLTTLADISNHAREFSQDQHGSRFIQQKLEHSSQEHIHSFYKELEPSVGDLMLDVFGNYVVQKLLDYGGAEIRSKVLTKVREILPSLTGHQFGCRVVQKIITSFSKDTAATIVQDLEAGLVEYMVEQHGNHVVQKCVERVENTVLQTIIDKCKGKINEISCDPYGCRVIQRFLENASPQQRRQILAEVNPTISHLIQDQYGNYIIQHILDHGSGDEAEHVVQSMVGHVVELAQHKYASNVLEKCVEKTSESHRSRFILELLSTGQIGSIIEGQYSNYVLQKMMDTAPSDVIQCLMVKLRAHKTSTEKHSYGKNIWARVENYFSQNIPL